MSDRQKAAAAAPIVVLGVTGSIAAYKAAELTSSLVQAGLTVEVIMTANALRLVQPQTFFTLSQRPVVTDLWELPDWQPGHIALAERAALLLIAPATANILAKLAHGIADDALSTYALSHSGRVLVAPAMNPRMWAHPAVQANCRLLQERGVRFVGPASGRVACGEGGIGRLAAVPDILAVVLAETGLAPAP
jgi:phosphopantothenoylcysteine synthetase/decarboxylase